MHDLLYDTCPRWPLGRLGLNLDAVSGLQLHVLTPSLASPNVIPQNAYRNRAALEFWDALAAVAGR